MSDTLLLVVNMNPSLCSKDVNVSEGIKKIDEAFTEGYDVMFSVDSEADKNGDVFVSELQDYLSSRFAYNMVEDLDEDDEDKVSTKYFNACKNLWFDDKLNDCQSDFVDWELINDNRIYNTGIFDCYKKVIVVGSLSGFNLQVFKYVNNGVDVEVL